MPSRCQVVRLTITGVTHNHSDLELTSEYSYRGYVLFVGPKDLHIGPNSQIGKNYMVARANNISQAVVKFKRFSNNRIRGSRNRLTKTLATYTKQIALESPELLVIRNARL